MSENLLEIQDLEVDFHTDAGTLKAVRRIGFAMQRGDVFGIVGESGCGKSVTARSILRLIRPPGQIRAGKIIFDRRDLLCLNAAEMRKVRGSRISMIFQEPMTSLDPLFPIGDQIMEAIRLHQGIDRKVARENAVSMLDKVGIPDAKSRMKYYPFQLSGGMRQRVMIATALSCKPEILIADEPTTALDVTIQAQILDLLEKLQQDIQMSMILITHDLSLVKNITRKLQIMYAGKIVESAPTAELFRHPLHPYTKGLFDCIPKLKGKRDLLETIPGTLPNLHNSLVGCAFSPRCRYKLEICNQITPSLSEVASGHLVSCHLQE
jgi:oligopeptide/dipeptide ABC transporter ATP-binding protein